jgi:hypothetical protein
VSMVRMPLLGTGGHVFSFLGLAIQVGTSRHCLSAVCSIALRTNCRTWSSARA